MKKLIAFIVVFSIIFVFVSCFDSGDGIDSTSSTSSSTSSTSSTTKRTDKTTSTSKGEQSGEDPYPDGHIYSDFASDEKSLFMDVIGDIIPFIPNDEYYVEEYSMNYGDEFEIGLNFYTFDNTKAEFEAYRASFSEYDFVDSDVDEYGDTWYYYDAPDGSYFVDMTYYYYEGAYVLDLYAYYLTESSTGGSGLSLIHI